MSGEEHTPGPWTVEGDDSLSVRQTLWRIVSEEARQRMRRLGSSARPSYVATVMRLGDAVLIASAPALRAQLDTVRKQADELLRLHDEVERERDEAQARFEAEFLRGAQLEHERDAALARVAKLEAALEPTAENVRAIAIALSMPNISPREQHRHHAERVLNTVRRLAGIDGKEG